MTAKEYLKQALELDKLIKAKKEQIRQLDDQRMSVSAVMSTDKVQSSHNHDRIADLTAMILDLQDIFFQDVTKLLVLKYDIQVLVESLENQGQRLILTERYINFKHWENIASDNNYSWMTVHRIHATALAVLCERHPDRFSPPKG